MSTTTQPLTKSYPSIAQSFAIVGLMILMMLLTTPIHILVRNFAGQEVATFVYYLLSMGLAFLIVNKIRHGMTGENTFVLTIDNPTIILPVIITTVALVYGVVSPLATLIPIPDFFKEVLRNLLNLNGVLAFAMMVVAAPIFEELIFRGIMLDGMLKKYSPTKAILASSFLFGIVHLNPWQFIAAFVIGIFAGWLYYRTKSLMPCIIVHATANLAGFLTRELTEVNLAFDDTIFTMYGSAFNLIVIVVGSIAVIYACVYYLGREFEKITSPPQDE